MPNPTDNGFNQPPTYSGNERNLEQTAIESSTLNYLIYARDFALTGQKESMGARRDFVVVKLTPTDQIENWIKPTPYIHRIGSGSKPYRLVGGQELVLSEDDVRVTGISKRYSLSEIWNYGVVYVLNPIVELGKINLEKSSVYELIFLDDSDPTSWTLNLRQQRDSRNYGKVALIP